MDQVERRASAKVLWEKQAVNVGETTHTHTHTTNVAQIHGERGELYEIRLQRCVTFLFTARTQNLEPCLVLNKFLSNE